MTRSNPSVAGGQTAAEPRLRCVLFGCVAPAAWLITDPQGGQLAACEPDVEVLLNDALARVPPESTVRIEVWRA
jgi:hypothetical protein